MQNPVTKLLKRRKALSLEEWASSISDQFISKFNSALAEVERFERTIKELAAELLRDYERAMRDGGEAELAKLRRELSADAALKRAREAAIAELEARKRELVEEFVEAIRPRLEELSEEAKKLAEQLESAMERAREVVSALSERSESAVRAVKLIEEKLDEMPLRPMVCDCGRVNLPTAKFCDACGKSLAPASA